MPSQSKPTALPALPKGEPLVALGQHVLNPGDALPLPLGEVDLRSKDGEGEPAEKYLQHPESEKPDGNQQKRRNHAEN